MTEQIDYKKLAASISQETGLLKMAKDIGELSGSYKGIALTQETQRGQLSEIFDRLNNPECLKESDWKQAKAQIKENKEKVGALVGGELEQTGFLHGARWVVLIIIGALSLASTVLGALAYFYPAAP